MKCPVCGEHEFEENYEFCPVCGWQHDVVQEEDPDEKFCANSMSVNEARVAYSDGKKIM